MLGNKRFKLYPHETHAKIHVKLFVKKVKEACENMKKMKLT